MHKGFEGLFGLVKERLGLSPLSGYLFLFANARRNRLKVLYWDGTGLWICSKRLERGRFSWPAEGDENGKVQLSYEELALLVGGIEFGRSGPGANASLKNRSAAMKIIAEDGPTQ
jgi:Transposase and inactivated derivatives